MGLPPPRSPHLASAGVGAGGMGLETATAATATATAQPSVSLLLMVWVQRTQAGNLGSPHGLQSSATTAAGAAVSVTAAMTEGAIMTSATPNTAMAWTPVQAEGTDKTPQPALGAPLPYQALMGGTALTLPWVRENRM